MKILVVYDSVFGNTEQVAQAIGRALGAPGQATMVKVGSLALEQLRGVELLVVGSPTRGFRPTPATTDFLGKIPARSLQGIRVAAFDTRIAVKEVNNAILSLFVRLFGYAARPMADKLVQKGGQLALPPEGFYVKGSEGPLKEGELERAATWAASMAKAA